MTPAQRALARAAKREMRLMEPEARRAYFQSLARLLQAAPGSILAARIEAGVPLADLIPARTLQQAFEPMREALRADASRGFRVATGMLNPQTGKRGGGSFGIAFNTLSPRVLEGIARMEDFILRNLSAEVRETVRRAVEAGIQAGKNPIDIARGIRDVIGLAPSHEQHVRNYRRKLEAVATGSRAAFENKLRDRRYDAAIRRALESGKPLSQAFIDERIADYARRYTAWHANVVARTATLNAFRAGQAASIEAAVEMGLAERGDIVKIWTTVGDDWVRDEHVAMEGETVRLDEPFSNGLMVPGEWNCRCIVLYEYRPPGYRTREEAIKLMRNRAKAPVPKPEPIVPPPVTPPPPPPVRSLTERINGPETEGERRFLEANAAPASFQSILESLRASRAATFVPSNPVQFRPSIDDELQASVTTKAREMDELFGPLTRHDISAYYTSEPSAWAHKAMGTIKFGPGYYRSADTVYHELTHTYQMQHREILEWEMKMYDKYAPGTTIRDITSLIGPGLKERVYGRLSNKFIRSYQGRIYEFQGKLHSAEFLTVAMELFATNPGRFARDYPEMYRDVLRLFYRINQR